MFKIIFLYICQLKYLSKLLNYTGYMNIKSQLYHNILLIKIINKKKDKIHLFLNY
jgi:hypothetical protein